MIITCPSCGRQLQVGDDLLGRKVKCPLCGSMFSTQTGSTPAPAGPTAAPAKGPPASEDFQERETRRASPPPPTRRRSRARDDYDDDHDYDQRPRRRRGTEESIRGPAVALLIVGILGLVLGPLWFLFFAFGGMGMFADNRVRQHQEVVTDAAVGTVGAVASVMQIAVSVLILVGALKMQRIQSHGWAMTSSILAMIPAVSPCCLLGLPFGIWALAVLNRDEVKDAFARSGGG